MRFQTEYLQQHSCVKRIDHHHHDNFIMIMMVMVERRSLIAKISIVNRIVLLTFLYLSEFTLFTIINTDKLLVKK